MISKYIHIFTALLFVGAGCITVADYCHAWEPIGSLPYGPVNSILEAGGRIWVAGGGTVFGFDPDEGNAPAVDTIFVYGSRRDLAFADGSLYLLTDSNGLFIFNITERPIRQTAHWMSPNNERLAGCAVLDDGHIVITSSAACVFFLSAQGDSLINTWSGEEGGGFSRVAVMGNLLLLVRGPYPLRMMLMDVSNVAQPESLSVTQFNDWVQDFMPVDDTLCYVSAATDGVYLMNLADPREPEEIIHAPIMYPDSKASSMSFDGEILLASHSGSRNQPEGGLGIYSAELDSIKWYRWTGGDIGAPLLRENEAWVLKAMEGIYNVNLENMERPRINWLRRLPHQVEGVFVRDNLAYLAEGHGGLRIIDYSEPADPHEIGWCDNVGLMEDIWVDGNHAYVADGNGLLIYDVHDPTRPDTVAHITAEQFRTRWVEGVAVENNILYTATHFKLSIGDVSDPGRPLPLGEVECTLLKDLAVRDGIAYLADNQFFRIIDCSQPRQPIQLAQIRMLGGEAWDVALRDTLALVTDRAYGLQVISIADLENPELLGTVEFDKCQGVDDDGYFTYVGLVWDGIAAVDISDPRNPEIIETFDTPGAVLNVKSDGEIVVAADYTAGTSYFPRPRLQSIREHGRLLLPKKTRFTVSPNPFNLTTEIQYNLHKSGWVTLRIIGVDGRLVGTLQNGWKRAGDHILSWDATGFPSGIYLCQLRVGGITSTSKLVLVK